MFTEGYYDMPEALPGIMERDKDKVVDLRFETIIYKKYFHAWWVGDVWYVGMHLSLRGAVGAKLWTPERHLEHFLRYRGICCSCSSCSNMPVLCSL